MKCIIKINMSMSVYHINIATRKLNVTIHGSHYIPIGRPCTSEGVQRGGDSGAWSLRRQTARGPGLQEEKWPPLPGGGSRGGL